MNWIQENWPPVAILLTLVIATTTMILMGLFYLAAIYAVGFIVGLWILWDIR